MEAAAILLLLLLILGIAGFVIYVFVDYRSYRTDAGKALKALETKEDDNAKAITAEGVARLAYVTDQINKVNKDIGDTVATKAELKGVNDKVTAQKTTTDALSATSTKLATGMDTFFKFDNASGTSTAIYDYVAGSGVTPADASLKLMRDTIALGSITAKDLTSAKPVKFCGGTGAAEQCIQVPNADGDTYITAVSANKKVVMGAPVQFNGAITTPAGSSLGILPGTGNVGIGTTTPGAALHVTATGNGDVFKAGNMTVNATTVTLGTGQGTATLTISPSNELVITPPAGGLRVAGKIVATGTVTGAAA